MRRYPPLAGWRTLRGKPLREEGGALRGKPLREEGGALVEPEEVECVGVKTMSEEVALLCARLEASEVREGEFTSCVAW